ncbi:hypothetical protein [Krasilnikovia sp. M28-CT-15]|uniref:hypothetical protein n=1 Tax=Krasilnikovia sp. M28-CT-15 TaxID=3373540 RepID=UPI003876413F
MTAPTITRPAPLMCEHCHHEITTPLADDLGFGYSRDTDTDTDTTTAIPVPDGVELIALPGRTRPEVNR